VVSWIQKILVFKFIGDAIKDSSLHIKVSFVEKVAKFIFFPGCKQCLGYSFVSVFTSLHEKGHGYGTYC